MVSNLAAAKVLLIANLSEVVPLQHPNLDLDMLHLFFDDSSFGCLESFFRGQVMLLWLFIHFGFFRTLPCRLVWLCLVFRPQGAILTSNKRLFGLPFRGLALGFDFMV